VPNAYATLADIKNELGETSTDATRDAILLRMLERASREADQYCLRHFFVMSATRYFDVVDTCKLFIDDCLSLSALTSDSEGDGTFDGTTFTQGDEGDYVFWPYNEWPKLALMPASIPDYFFCRGEKILKAVGLWGYGDGGSATPYRSSGLTGTVATTTGTTLTASADASAVVYPGQTILIGTEQMYVSAVSTTSITVERGVNGTTAAAQNAAAFYIYKYPLEVETYVLECAKDAYLTRKLGDMQMEMIGQYQYQRAGAKLTEYRTDELLGKYRRMVA